MTVTVYFLFFQPFIPLLLPPINICPDLDAAAASMKGEVARAPVPEYLNSLVTEQLAKTHEKIGLAEERKVVLALYALAQTSMQALTLLLLLSNNSNQCTVRWQFLNGFTLGQVGR